MADGRERADWVRNVMADPRVTVRVGAQEGQGRGRVVEAGADEDALARRLLLSKYQPPGSSDLERWAVTALPVAFDLSFAP